MTQRVKIRGTVPTREDTDQRFGKLPAGMATEKTLLQLEAQAATETTLAAIDAKLTVELLKNLLTLLAQPIYLDTSTGRLWIAGAVSQSGTWNIGTVTTVTTVGAVSNLAAVGGYAAGELAIGQNNGPWTEGVRGLVS
jgi:hypothetical protein